MLDKMVTLYPDDEHVGDPRDAPKDLPRVRGGAERVDRETKRKG
jgi:hypothetical protein